MEILENYSLASWNTFGVDQRARYFATVRDPEEFLALARRFERPLILGGGSNILITRDLDVLVIKNEMKGISVIGEDAGFARVRVNGGENWHQFVQWAVARGWGGVENLSLIPGTVGAAPMQNIGAYGVEIKDVVLHVEALDLETGSISVFQKEECRFGYRHSIFKEAGYKNRFFILSVTLQLDKHPQVNTRYADVEKKLLEQHIEHPGIMDVHRAVIEIRQNKLPDPARLGNAGSFFKNPVLTEKNYQKLQSIKPDAPHYTFQPGLVKVPAGWLIDQAGWRGRKAGRVGCYEKQALVIVNLGGATGAEIRDFALTVQEDVRQKFGIQLEPEINIW